MPVHEVTNADAWKAVVGSGLVVVDFYTTWCGPCKHFAPKFLDLSDCAEYAGVTFVKVNIENDNLDEVLQSVGGISSIPTFASFKDGVMISKFPGASIDKLTSMLEHLVHL